MEEINTKIEREEFVKNTGLITVKEKPSSYIIAENPHGRTIVEVEYRKGFINAWVVTHGGTSIMNKIDGLFEFNKNWHEHSFNTHIEAIEVFYKFYGKPVNH